MIRRVQVQARASGVMPGYSSTVGRRDEITLAVDLLQRGVFALPDAGALARVAWAVGVLCVKSKMGPINSVHKVSTTTQRNSIMAVSFSTIVGGPNAGAFPRNRRADTVGLSFWRRKSFKCFRIRLWNRLGYHGGLLPIVYNTSR